MAENEINNITPHIPPNDMDAEQALLGCMLFDSEGIIAATEILTEDDFYRPQNKLIFKAITELFSNGEPVDLVTLKNKLSTMGAFEQIGGMEALVELGGIVSTSANTRYYANIISEKSTLRRLIKASATINEMSYDSSKSLDSIIENAEKSLDEIIAKRVSDGFTPISNILTETIDRLEALSKNKSRITGIETGFADFDRKTAGLQPSDLILIAARPSMGKSALALNIAQYAALKKNAATAIFSLEMSKEQVVNRMLCSYACVDSQKLRTGDINQDDWDKLAEAIGQYSDAPIFIDDNSDTTIANLKSKCRKLKREHGLDLIIIDYLQLMNSGTRSESRQNEISSISRSLKALAREINAPVIALSQLSRAVEQRPNHRPMLSDLRESGAIEQDADVVCFIYRDDYYNKENSETPGQAEIIIAKQRNGEIGTINLMWLAQFTKFASIEKTL